MSRKIDLTGHKFEKLTVLNEAGKTKDGKIKWMCNCDCGNKTIVIGKNLRNGHTKSCGCLNIGSNIQHGKSNTGTYRIWCAMLRRCNNRNNEHYADYGGRGIKVCLRWRKFENFISDMGDRPGKNYTIERIDNEAGYTPKNCEWATKKRQARNRRTTFWITFNKERKSLIEWTEEFGMPYETVRKRIRIYGWDIERALTEPVRR